MVTKTPAQLKPGNATDTSVVHSSQDDNTNLSRKHTERDISRRQAAAKAYSNIKTYKIGDIVTFEDQIYRCIEPVTIPESFDPSKWELVIKNQNQIALFSMSNNNTTMTVLGARYFTVNAGLPSPPVINFVNRAMPIPFDIELDQYAVSILSLIHI